MYPSYIGIRSMHVESAREEMISNTFHTHVHNILVITGILHIIQYIMFTLLSLDSRLTIAGRYLCNVCILAYLNKFVKHKSCVNRKKSKQIKFSRCLMKKTNNYPQLIAIIPIWIYRPIILSYYTLYEIFILKCYEKDFE